MSCYYLKSHMIDSYRRQLINEEHRPSTIEKYLRDLQQFSRWLSGQPVYPHTAAEWKTAHLEQGLAPATINSKLAALNGFFRHMKWSDCSARYLKVQRRIFRDAGRELDRNDYRRLVDTARNIGNRRLALVMETLCGCGIRVSELSYITVEAARRGRAEVHLKSKIRVILLPARLCRKLLQYSAKQKIAHGEIFLTASGKRLSRRQIWAEMKRLAVVAGVAPSKVFPHNLRHLFATAFYASCHDIVRLADVLGHSSIETTRIYLITSGVEHQRQLERLGLVL